MDPNLIKVTEIFLVSSSFLVAALGTADSNPHRAGVSLLGLIVSALWLVCSQEALTEYEPGGLQRSRRARILASLPLIFLVGWVVSMVVHVMLWGQTAAS